MNTPARQTSPRPLPRTGAVTGVLEALAFFRDPGFAQKRFAEYGNVFATNLLGQPLVFIKASGLARMTFGPPTPRRVSAITELVLCDLNETPTRFAKVSRTIWPTL